MTKLKNSSNSKINIRYSIARSLLSIAVAVLLISASLGFASKKSEKMQLSNIPDGSASPTSIPDGSASPTSSDSSVWILRDDGAKFCVTGSGVTLEEGSAELQAAQIVVLESKKGSDGKMHAQVCGGSRGSTNTYLINRDKIKQAVALGYSEVISLR